MIENVAGYRLVTRLGNGGMAVVFLGESIDPANPQEYVAVKTVSNERFIPHLHREAAALKRLSGTPHPNIIRLLGHGPGYVITELLIGVTLDQLLKTYPKLPQSAALRIISQVCAGLATIHGAGILHRDVKPENIFVVLNDAHPGHWDIKIIDFGIAKILDPKTADECDDTGSVGMVLGTPNYMSPEQAFGDRLDARSDLYAVGCLLYRLLTGLNLHDAKNPMSALRDILAQTLPEEPPPSSGIDQRVWDLLLRLVSIDVYRRPPSAQAVLDELYVSTSPLRPQEMSHTQAILPPTPSQ